MRTANRRIELAPRPYLDDLERLRAELDGLRALGDALERVVAVTSVPDARKGERIVVLYTDDAGDPAALGMARLARGRMGPPGSAPP